MVSTTSRRLASSARARAASVEAGPSETDATLPSVVAATGASVSCPPAAA